MRIHLSATVLLLTFSAVYKPNYIEVIILLFCIGFVIISEMLNTSIEAITNYKSPEKSDAARIAKDVAAGAVAVSAMISLAVGCIIFIKPQKLYETWNYFIAHPIALIGYLFLIALCVAFIFKGPRFFIKKKDK